MPNAGDFVRAGDTTRYYCKATQSLAQSINSGVFTAITFNGTNDVDTLGIHDSVTNNSRLTIGLKLGWWHVSGKYSTTGTAAGISRRLRLVMNGATGVNGAYAAWPAFSATAMTGGFWSFETSSLMQASLSTDYVELHAFQDSGGALNTIVSGDLRSSIYAIYLGP